MRRPSEIAENALSFLDDWLWPVTWNKPVRMLLTVILVSHAIFWTVAAVAMVVWALV